LGVVNIFKLKELGEGLVLLRDKKAVRKRNRKGRGGVGAKGGGCKKGFKAH